MAHRGDKQRNPNRLRRRLAALACALLIGQSVAIAHVLDAQAHVDDQPCQLCHVTNPAGGATPAIAGATLCTAAEPAAVEPRDDAGPARVPALLPPSRAPPTHLTID